MLTGQHCAGTTIWESGLMAMLPRVLKANTCAASLAASKSMPSLTTPD